MVSNRCKIAVKEELTKLGLYPPKNVFQFEV